MGLETGTYIDDLVATNPVASTDSRREGDDHLRLIKSVLKNTFPNLDGAVTPTPAELNKLAGLGTTQAELAYLSGVISAISTFLQAADTDAARQAVGFPGLSGNGSKLLAINSGASALEAVTTLSVLEASGGWQLVEYADLSVGGISEYDLTHTLEDGYVYRLVVWNASASSDGHLTVRMRNDLGSWLTSSGDYIEAANSANGTGTGSETAAAFFPYNFSGISATGYAGFNFNFDIYLYGAMDTGFRTTMMARSMLSNASSCNTCFSAAVLPVADGHDKIRIRTTAGNFDAGRAWLFRIKEPTA